MRKKIDSIYSYVKNKNQTLLWPLTTPGDQNLNRHESILPQDACAQV